jgi:hypothetical protein
LVHHYSLFIVGCLLSADSFSVPRLLGAPCASIPAPGALYLAENKLPGAAEESTYPSVRGPGEYGSCGGMSIAEPDKAVDSSSSSRLSAEFDRGFRPLLRENDRSGWPQLLTR